MPEKTDDDAAEKVEEGESEMNGEIRKMTWRWRRGGNDSYHCI